MGHKMEANHYNGFFLAIFRVTGSKKQSGMRYLICACEKPCWDSLIKSLVVRKSITSSFTVLSMGLARMSVWFIGRQFCESYSVLFLWRGTVVGNFHGMGNIPVYLEIVSWFNKRSAISGLPRRNCAGRTPSEPGQQDGLMTVRTFSIFSVLHAMDEIVSSAILGRVGKLVALSVTMVEEKSELKASVIPLGLSSPGCCA